MATLLSEMLAVGQAGHESAERDDVIVVSDTVSAAASVYETIRNTLEYDEDHLLRRNAVRRILKRALGEHTSQEIAEKLLRELIWARYLPNKRVPESMTAIVAGVLSKYRMLFDRLPSNTAVAGKLYDWLLDALSTEIDQLIVPARMDEAMSSLAYSHFARRIHWISPLVAPKDRDLQTFIAVQRAVLKANLATLRFRLLALYYPAWTSAQASDDVVAEIAAHVGKVVS